ncbi:MAG: M1 family metallopeptidase [Lewinellaceae bacterium]|nr:M1 family metallopeptidase [Lewinellaceae bacterium]
MKKLPLLLLGLLLTVNALWAQADRWQQRVNYTMVIDMDVPQQQYHGTQTLLFTNNSPDTLDKVFYHLYFNAFQPNSMMDVRSRTILDADKRVADCIQQLKPEEQGWIKVKSLSQNGKKAFFTTNETILEVGLAEPILPNSTTTLVMEWDAQVPVQIRRSGRDNAEGVAYSMSQWYPKMCNYDYQGWHADPYVGREFYGIWGDFDVTINIDRNYLVAAGGYLQNPDEIGYGYEKEGAVVKRPAGDKLRWHFKTPNVHDFVWAADPDFTHTKIQAKDGSVLHFVWQKGQGYDDKWEKLPAIMDRARTIMNETCGRYAYKEYYFIQGGDGGMEYPLATLITGNRPMNSLVGVAVHEQLHSWYQMMLGSNESLYPWMDEGFTSWAEAIVENQLAAEGLMGKKEAQENPFEGNYRGYYYLAKSGKEEPMSTHADHYQTNMAYGLAAYSKGAVFLSQLEYIVGKTTMRRGMLRYFNTWKFHHPNPNDFIRIMEKESGLELDWYREDWVNTTNTIDYSIKSVDREDRKSTKVVIERKGKMAMPLEIVVTMDNGNKVLFYAPLESMRGEKPVDAAMPRTLLPDHRWVDPEYSFEVPIKVKNIAKIEIDPTHLMADINQEDNVWEPKSPVLF